MSVQHFAPVAPLATLQKLYEATMLGRYQLLIAPIVLEKSWAYGRFFYEHNNQHVILDNGVIELGYPLTADELVKAAVVVNADVVVMPDSIDDGRYTVKLTRAALAGFRKLDRYGRQTMGVVQGTTMEECLTCASDLVSLGVDWLAVPRGLTPNLGTRVPLVKYLAEEYSKPIHVLGFSDNLKDDIEAATCHRAVRGIDAATPTWTTKLLPMEPPASPEYSKALGRRPKGFWDDQESEHAVENVATVRHWLNVAMNARIEREGLAAPTDQVPHG